MIQVKLNQVCKILNGFAFKSEEYQSEGVPLLRISNFDGGDVVVDDKSIYVDQSFLNTKTDFIVEKGDILIALSGATTGKYGIYNYDFPSLLNQRIGLIKSSASNKLSGKYFYHFLNILKDEILRKAGGAAQPNISTKTIGELEIPLPSLPQQQKIANILDAADALRQNDKALIAKYDELTQALFLDMFGDSMRNIKNFKEIKLSEIVRKDKIITYGIVQAGENIENGVPYIRTGDIKNGKIVIKNLLKTSFEIAKSYERSKCVHGDIVMSIRATVGTIAIIPPELDGVNLTQGTARISPNTEIINRDYLFHCIKSNGVQLKIEKQTKGATFREITLSRLRDIEIPLPPPDLQSQFAERVKLIEEQKTIAQKSLEKSESLFNSLLQKAFKGELE